MKAEYLDVWYVNGEEISGEQKEVELPFKRISARAIIVRRKDDQILGTLHREGGQYALPGGALEDGESTIRAVQRELTEEGIELIKPDWNANVAVDFYAGYGELSVWHLVLVKDAVIGASEENIESRWIDQNEDVWYPHMREDLIQALNRYLPDHAKAHVTVAMT
jgi:8-oxo-dGTP pyrophosphatase MutT (NUDIX family)